MVRKLSILLLVWLLTACQASEEVLPTLVEFPTLTATLTPTSTPTITPTSTLTATLTPTTTPTFTPSMTPTQTNTPAPSPTWTSTWTRTPAPTSTPTATLTPLPTLPPAPPEIRVFQANKANAEPGSEIILRWEVDGESATIEILTVAGVVAQTIDVQVIDVLRVNLPIETGTAVYRLIARRGEYETQASVAVEIGTTCTLPWSINPAPTSAGCAAGTSLPAPFTYQTFQSGFMFRIQISGLDKVCGVQNDRNLYSCYQYQSFSGTPPVQPPLNFLPPAPEVANSFYSSLAVGGFWYTVIGWANNQSLSVSVQAQPGIDGKLYIQTPFGVYAFDGQLAGLGQSVVRIGQ
jgi:hypothetical protein